MRPPVFEIMPQIIHEANYNARKNSQKDSVYNSKTFKSLFTPRIISIKTHRPSYSIAFQIFTKQLKTLTKHHSFFLLNDKQGHTPYVYLRSGETMRHLIVIATFLLTAYTSSALKPTAINYPPGYLENYPLGKATEFDMITEVGDPTRYVDVDGPRPWPKWWARRRPTGSLPT